MNNQQGRSLRRTEPAPDLHRIHHEANEELRRWTLQRVLGLDGLESFTLQKKRMRSTALNVANHSHLRFDAQEIRISSKEMVQRDTTRLAKWRCMLFSSRVGRTAPCMQVSSPSSCMRRDSAVHRLQLENLSLSNATGDASHMQVTVPLIVFVFFSDSRYNTRS